VAALAVFFAIPQDASADDSGRVGALLARSREVATQQDYEGTMVVRWRAGGKMRERTVAVRVHDGTLRLGHGRVLGAGDRRLMKEGGQSRLIWSEPPPSKLPDPSDKYRFTVLGAAPVAGRATTAVAIERADGSAGRERLYFDRASGLLLRRDQWDHGRLTRRVAFVRITDPVPGDGDSRAASRLGAGAGNQPPATGEAPDDVSAARRLGDGFELMGTYGRPDGDTQLYYSDGLFGLSLFAADGDLAWDELPEGGQAVEVGDVDARVYRTPAGSAVLWDDEDVTYTAVTDAPLHEVEVIIADLERRHEPSTLDDIGRFVTRPFSWG
jgi:hypothetical protein